MPYDLVAERALLGALLLGPSPVDEIEAYTLTPEAFFAEAHALVFEACKALNNERASVDELTVGDRLRSQGTLAKVGGVSAIAQLLDAVPMAANLSHYVRIVRDHWRRRLVYHGARAAIAAVLDDTQSADDALNVANAALTAAQTKQATTHATPVRPLLLETFKQLEARRASDAPDAGVRTGFTDLDAYTSGFQPGNFVIVAGRPSMGKSAFAFQAALHAATAEGKRALVCSLEMTEAELIERALSSRARVDLMRLRNPKTLADGDFPKLANAAGYISEARLLIDDKASSLDEIRATARLTQIAGGLDVLFIDYVQLVRPPMRDKVREREVSEISRGLKLLAKELGAPVVALAQLNRELEKRTDKRPRKSDLRESGSLEQDADVIVFLHRPAEYDDKADPTLAEVILDKQRNGPTGIVELSWEKQFASFRNREKRHAA